MMTHSDLELKTAILFYDSSEGTIATMGVASKDGGIVSGKMLTKGDLYRAIESVDGSGLRWLDTSKHHHGGLLHQNGSDIIWWTEKKRQEVRWKGGSAMMNWPTLIFRRDKNNNIYVAAWEVDPMGGDLSCCIWPILMPDISKYRSHMCNVWTVPSHEAQQVEDAFHNSLFTEKPQGVEDGGMEYDVPVDRTGKPLDMDGFYNATC